MRTHWKKVILSSVMGLMALAVYAQNYTVNLSTDKKDAIYKQSEKIIFSLQLLKDGKPVTGKDVEYLLKTDGKADVKKVFKSTENAFEIESSLNKPGWTWLTATPLNNDGKPFKFKDSHGRERIRNFSIGAMVDPLEIKPGMNEPTDFDEFWKKQRDELNAIPVKATETSVEVPKAYQGIFDCFEVKVDCLGEMPVSGYLSIPVNAKAGTLKAVVRYHGAGVRSANQAFYQNAITLDVNAHGIENGKPAKFYSDLAQNALRNYPHRDADNRDKFYFRDMFLRVMRALDYIKTRPEWNGKDLIVIGGSQGGAQALVAAALDKQVSLCIAGVPALCDHGGIFAERNSGWPRLIKLKDGKAENPKIVESCGYFDGVNFAKRISCETYISTGFADNTCVPTSVYAAFNSIPDGVKKAINTTPTAGHGAPNQKGAKRMKEVLSFKF